MSQAEAWVFRFPAHRNSAPSYTARMAIAGASVAAEARWQPRTRLTHPQITAHALAGIDPLLWRAIKKLLTPQGEMSFCRRFRYHGPESPDYLRSTSSLGRMPAGVLSRGQQTRSSSHHGWREQLAMLLMAATGVDLTVALAQWWTLKRKCQVACTLRGLWLWFCWASIFSKNKFKHLKTNSFHWSFQHDSCLDAESWCFIVITLKITPFFRWRYPLPLWISHISALRDRFRAIRG